jgi:hypothetical protein
MPVVPAYRLYRKRRLIKKGLKWVKRGGKWTLRRVTAKKIRERVRTEKKPSMGHKHRESQRGRGYTVPGRLKTRKTMRARSAQKNGAKRKTVPYRKGGCPPGYRYDPKLKLCVLYTQR